MTVPEPRAEQSFPGGWRDLTPGDRVTVIKLAPDGAEVARYPGAVVARVRSESWVVIQATWTNRTIELDGLTFCPGDNLLEWFSPERHFNAFAVHAPSGPLKGWYANVTYPAWLDVNEKPPCLFWQDVYVDLVGLPDGTFTIRDEDELRGSRLEQCDPDLYYRVLLARDELVRRFQSGVAPFADVAKIRR